MTRYARQTALLSRQKKNPGQPLGRLTRVLFVGGNGARLGRTPVGPTQVAIRLEDELQAKLHDARRPGAIDKAVAGIAVGCCPATDAKRCIAVTPVVHALVLGVVEGVEGFPPELKGGMFTGEPGQLKVLEQCQVGVVAARTGQHIAAHVPEHAGFAVGQELSGRGLRDGVRVPPLQGRPIAGFVGDGLVDLHRSHRVAADGGADPTADTGDTAVEVDRLAGEEARDAADFPAAQRSLGEFVARVLEERQFIDVTELQHLRAVEARGSLPTAELLVIDEP